MKDRCFGPNSVLKPLLSAFTHIKKVSKKLCEEAIIYVLVIFAGNGSKI